MADIAIYICCYCGDYHFAKILCQSIRHFCGNTPIYLIKDGNFSTSQIKRLGNIREFEESEVVEPLRGIKGWGLKKLYAFFQRSHERFLYLDADIVLLNNPFLLPYQSTDFYVDTSGFKDLNSPIPGIRTRGRFPLAATPYTFDPIKIRIFDPQFDLDNVLLFNSGHIFGRTGLLDINAVAQCIEEVKKGSDLHFFWDGGILNYLLNKGHQEGRFTLGGECFRILGDDPPENWPTLTPQRVLNGDFHDRSMIHWAGPSKRGKEVPYGSILKAFQTLYYRRLHPFAYYLDVAQRVLSSRLRGISQRLRRVMSALRPTQ